MVSDGSDLQGTDADQQSGDEQVGTDAGGDQQSVGLDKVAEILREHAGIDLDVLVKGKVDTAAAEAAKEAGRTAQKTYDPRIAAMEKELQIARAEAERTRKDVRLAEIAKMPAEKQEAARKLLDAEETIRGMAGMKAALNEAAKAVTAERMALDLGKRGITAEAADFMECATPQDMEARAADLRAEAAERKLKEAEAGGKPKKEERQPPAVSQKAAPKKPATGGETGRKPWEEHSGKGFKGLGDALRAQREAG